MIYNSSERIKNNLSAHRWLGLAFGAILYLLCLSGSLLVFSDEIERWEHPGAEEFTQLEADSIATAYAQGMARVSSELKTLWVVLPTQSLPRAHVNAGDKEWYLDAEGNLLDEPALPWLDTLIHLHYYLHLPESFGMIVVAIFGVILLSLTISGVLAHPSILKDAFKYRRGKTERLEQTDLHNRLGVWGLPFNIMIAITGAFIGLSSVFLLFAAPLFYENDRSKIIETIYGGDIYPSNQTEEFNIQRMLADLAKRAPEAKPIYFAFQNPGSSEQYVEIAATLPGRLVYSEIYRFEASGAFVNHQALADGPAGRQIAYSVYRLHFGAFGGLVVKILYFLFGLALCTVCVSGFNIWFSKQAHQSRLNRLWTVVVWGIPFALVFTALLSAIGIAISGAVIFWSTVVSLLFAAGVIKPINKLCAYLKQSLGMCLLLLVVSHLLAQHQDFSVLPLVFNGVLLAASMYFLLPMLTKLKFISSLDHQSVS